RRSVARSLQGCLRAAQPRITLGVLGRVVGVEVDEAALDLPVADLEDVAPPARRPLRYPSPPRAVLVLAMAGALADDDVAAGEDPVEVRVMMGDRLEGRPYVGEELADLLRAIRQPPFGEVHLRVFGEQVQDASAR